MGREAAPNFPYWDKYRCAKCRDVFPDPPHEFVRGNGRDRPWGGYSGVCKRCYERLSDEDEKLQR